MRSLVFVLVELLRQSQEIKACGLDENGVQCSFLHAGLKILANQEGTLRGLCSIFPLGTKMRASDFQLSAQKVGAESGFFPESTWVRNVWSPVPSSASRASSRQRRGERTPLSERNVTPRIAEKLKSLTDILKNIEEKPFMKQNTPKIDWKLNKLASLDSDFPALRHSVYGQINSVQQEKGLLHKVAEIERKTETDSLPTQSSKSSPLEHSGEDSYADKISPRDKITSGQNSVERIVSDSQCQGLSVSLRCVLKESIFDKLKADSQALSSIKSSNTEGINNLGQKVPVRDIKKQQEELPTGFNWTSQNYFDSQSTNKGPNERAADTSLHAASTTESLNIQTDFTKEVLQRLESMEQIISGKFSDEQSKVKFCTFLFILLL
eukprot:Gb_14737 [translate_table: standard]